MHICTVINVLYRNFVNLFCCNTWGSRGKIQSSFLYCLRYACVMYDFFYFIRKKKEKKKTLNCQTLNNLCLCLSCSIFVLQSKLTDSSFQNDNTSRFQPKKRPGTRAITNSGQLQNNCPLFVWQNQDNFMQSVIKPIISANKEQT